METRRFLWVLFAAGSLALAWHPVEWLVRTWTDPSYGSDGWVYLVILLGLAVRSLLSGSTEGLAPARLGVLLCLAAAVRFLSQTLAVNLIGGLALAIDVYALALLAGLDRRPKPLAPVWLAVLFLFSLPVGNVLERVLGFPLQRVSADLSCALLSAVFPGTVCEGVRIGIGAQDVLVDLPCSGASGLMLVLSLFAGLSAVLRPRIGAALLWGLLALVLAVLGNTVRIALLAAGIVAGVDVMAEPLHSAIGLFTLGLSALPLLFFFRPSPRVVSRRGHLARPLPGWFVLPAAVGFLFLSLWIVTRPPAPLDVSRPVPPAPFPRVIAGEVGQAVALSPVEERYFRAYGGQAVKVRYGALGLNRVSTTSPLRHLHSPEACLRGLGYATRFLGTHYDGAPSSVYEAVSPDGARWLVSVTYLSDTGEAVPSVGEAIWRWMNGRGAVWSSVQRIVPLALPEADRRALDAAARAALDIPVTNKEPLS